MWPQRPVQVIGHDNGVKPLLCRERPAPLLQVDLEHGNRWHLLRQHSQCGGIPIHGQHGMPAIRKTGSMPASTAGNVENGATRLHQWRPA